MECEERGPGWPEVPIIELIANASAVAASRALYISGSNKDWDFASAERRRGWFSGFSGIVDSIGDMLLPRPRFGEEDIVVAVVVAVGGLSLEARDMAAPDVAGNFPVNSNLCILDLSSSNSSHKVDGAVVDTVDSVPSAARGVSTLSCICMSADRETSGEELYVRGVEYDRFDCRYEVPRAGFVWSGIEGRRPP